MSVAQKGMGSTGREASVPVHPGPGIAAFAPLAWRPLPFSTGLALRPASALFALAGAHLDSVTDPLKLAPAEPVPVLTLGPGGGR